MNWYSKALKASTYNSWTINCEDESPILQLSKRFDKIDGSPLVVTCVELNLVDVQVRIIDQVNIITSL